MVNKKHINETQAFHLNFGIPIVIGIALLIINLEFFALVFLEKMSDMMTIYMYSTFIVLALIFFLAKKNKEGVRKINLSFYDFLVHNSALVLIFLLINYNFSKPVLEKKIAYDKYYSYDLLKNEVPPKYLKLFETDLIESREYFNTHYIYVRVDKSIFGYDFIKEREFIRNNY